MALTTTSVLSAPVQQSFSQMLLSVPAETLIHNLFALKFRMPKQGGTTLRMRRYNRLGTSPVPLGNSGVNPPSKTLSAVDIDAKMDFYGTWLYINEQCTLQAQDPILTEAAKLLGMDLRETEDQLTRDMLAATASVVNCTKGVNGQNPTNITRSDIDLVYRTLIGGNAKTISQMIDGTNKFGTAPVRNCFLAMCHSDLTPDLQNVYGFKPTAEYPSQTRIGESEFGNISNIRFWISSAGSVLPNASSMGQNVYNIFVTGIEAYGIVDQDGYSQQFRVAPKEIAGGPLMLNATAAYVTAMVPRLLNDAWLIALRASLQIS